MGQTRPVTLQDYKSRLLRVLVHIQEHLDEPLALEELARLACFSPYHFHRIFTGMVGESLQGHVRRLRLERAATRLKLSRAQVTRIAFEAGYDSHEAFTRAFRLLFGISPSQYRASRRQLAAAAVPSGVRYTPGQAVGRFRPVRSGDRTMEVKIQRLKPIRVAFTRHVGPYDEVGTTWDKLLPWLGKEGLIGGDAMLIGICHDDPEVTPRARIRYDACVSVDGHFAPTGEIGVQIIPGGDYAVTTHFGPYNKLGETYAKLLGQWLPRNGRELRSTSCFEAYLNDPHGTEPADLLTDIYAPLTQSSSPTTHHPTRYESHRKNRSL